MTDYDFDTAPTTEYCPRYADHACPRCLVTHSGPWFPLGESTEAGREWEQRDNHETQAATPRAKEKR